MVVCRGEASSLDVCFNSSCCVSATLSIIRKPWSTVSFQDVYLWPRGSTGLYHNEKGGGSVTGDVTSTSTVAIERLSPSSGVDRVINISGLILARCKEGRVGQTAGHTTAGFFFEGET